MPHLSLCIGEEREGGSERPVDRPMITSSSREWQLCRCAPSPSRDPNSLIEEHNNKEVGGWEEGKESEKISPGKK